jgi:uncharacterized membrane protein YoaK (UPF0700 family)
MRNPSPGIKLDPSMGGHESLPFGLLLALVGGYLDAFTYVAHGGVFCNAQTGNIVFLGLSLAEGKWGKALAYLPPILAFLAGALVAETLKGRPRGRRGPDWPALVLGFETLVLILVGFLGAGESDALVAIAVSFAAAIQASSFTSIAGTSYTSTMCTGNLKSIARAIHGALAKSEAGAARTALRLGAIILAFAAGASLGAALTRGSGGRSVWVAALILFCVTGLFLLSERKRPKT